MSPPSPMGVLCVIIAAYVGVGAASSVAAAAPIAIGAVAARAQTDRPVGAGTFRSRRNRSARRRRSRAMQERNDRGLRDVVREIFERPVDGQLPGMLMGGASCEDRVVGARTEWPRYGWPMDPGAFPGTARAWRGVFGRSCPVPWPSQVLQANAGAGRNTGVGDVRPIISGVGRSGNPEILAGARHSELGGVAGRGGRAAEPPAAERRTKGDYSPSSSPSPPACCGGLARMCSKAC